MDGSAARAEPYFEVMRPPGEIGIEPVDLVRERFEDFKALKHGFESRARFHPREIIAETEMRPLPDGHQREGALAVEVEVFWNGEFALLAFGRGERRHHGGSLGNLTPSNPSFFLPFAEADLTRRK